MIIKLHKPILRRIIRKLSVQPNKRYYLMDSEVAEILKVNPVTLSRQANSGKIDITYLHRYLQTAGFIANDVPCPDLESFEVYLKLLPVDSQNQIKKELLK